MKWLELSVKTPPEFVEPLTRIFYRYGHGGVAVEEDGGFNLDEGESPPADRWVTVKAYLPLNSTTGERRNRIDLGVRLVAHVSPISSLHETVLEEEEWQNSWKEHFQVLHIGQSIVICPTWIDYEPAESEALISLDPGMAFGTGHHPTTRACLELLEDLGQDGMDVLDVGCGSGILSIAAAKLGARSVFALEIDSESLRVVKQNIRDNGTGQNIRVAEGSLPHADVQADSFDIAVANISSKVVSDISGELVRAVRPGGKIIASGMLVDNKEAVEQALTSAGGSLEKTVVDGDWVTIVASTPSPRPTRRLT